MGPSMVVGVAEIPGSFAAPVKYERFSDRSLWHLLGFVVLNTIVLNVVMVSFLGLLARHHLSPPFGSTFGQLHSFVNGQQGDDSWAPMLAAIHVIEESPNTSPYQKIFFQNHVKFQYPLSSLLPYYALQKLGASDDELLLMSKVATWLSVCGTIVLTVAIALMKSSARGLVSLSRRQVALVAGAIALAGVMFYPLMKGFSLGQIQTVLVLGFTAAFYCWISGREKAAGALMGVMALVKPQYALFLVWALLRRRWGALSSALICAAVGTLISCVVFGWHSNLDYLGVLRAISRSGESFAANQSANGLLNRLLFNGNNLLWDGGSFPPYNRIVYFGTLASSLALIGLALFYPWGSKRGGGPSDFACLTLTATTASPVAWEHHYGIVFPILAWLWFHELAAEREQRGIFAVGGAYLLTSNYMAPTYLLASMPILNIVESYLFFGGLLLLLSLFRSHDIRQRKTC